MGLTQNVTNLTTDTSHQVFDWQENSREKRGSDQKEHFRIAILALSLITQNICFGWEIRKLIFRYLTKGLNIFSSLSETYFLGVQKNLLVEMVLMCFGWDF